MKYLQPWMTKIIVIILGILALILLISWLTPNDVRFQYSITLSETEDHYLWAHYDGKLVGRELQETGLMNNEDNSTILVEYEIRVQQRGDDGILQIISDSGYRKNTTGIFFRTQPIDLSVGLYDYEGLINVTGFEPVQIKGAMSVTKGWTNYHIVVLPSEVPPPSVWDSDH